MEHSLSSNKIAEVKQFEIRFCEKSYKQEADGITLPVVSIEELASIVSNPALQGKAKDLGYILCPTRKIPFRVGDRLLKSLKDESLVSAIKQNGIKKASDFCKLFPKQSLIVFDIDCSIDGNKNIDSVRPGFRQQLKEVVCSFPSVVFASLSSGSGVWGFIWADEEDGECAIDCLKSWVAKRTCPRAQKYLDPGVLSILGVEIEYDKRSLEFERVRGIGFDPRPFVNRNPLFFWVASEADMRLASSVENCRVAELAHLLIAPFEGFEKPEILWRSSAMAACLSIPSLIRPYAVDFGADCQKMPLNCVSWVTMRSSRGKTTVINDVLSALALEGKSCIDTPPSTGEGIVDLVKKATMQQKTDETETKVWEQKPLEDRSSLFLFIDEAGSGLKHKQSRNEIANLLRETRCFADGQTSSGYTKSSGEIIGRMEFDGSFILFSTPDSAMDFTSGDGLENGNMRRFFSFDCSDWISDETYAAFSKEKRWNFIVNAIRNFTNYSGFNFNPVRTTLTLTPEAQLLLLSSAKKTKFLSDLPFVRQHVLKAAGIEAVYNGREQITEHDILCGLWLLEQETKSLTKTVAKSLDDSVEDSGFEKARKFLEKKFAQGELSGKQIQKLLTGKKLGLDRDQQKLSFWIPLFVCSNPGEKNAVKKVFSGFLPEDRWPVEIAASVQTNTAAPRSTKSIAERNEMHREKAFENLVSEMEAIGEGGRHDAAVAKICRMNSLCERDQVEARPYLERIAVASVSPSDGPDELRDRMRIVDDVLSGRLETEPANDVTDRPFAPVPVSAPVPSEIWGEEKVKEVESKQANLSEIKAALVSAEFESEKVAEILTACSSEIDRLGRVLSEDEVQNLIDAADEKEVA